MDSKSKVLENLARRTAKRLGFALHKDRQRTPHAPGYNTYRIEDAGTVVAQGVPLGDVLEALERAREIAVTTKLMRTVLLQILMAADQAGWRATPPNGGEAQHLTDVIPWMFGKYREMKSFVGNDQATQ